MRDRERGGRERERKGEKDREGGRKRERERGGGGEWAVKWWHESELSRPSSSDEDSVVQAEVSSPGGKKKNVFCQKFRHS